MTEKREYGLFTSPSSYNQGVKMDFLEPIIKKYGNIL